MEKDLPNLVDERRFRRNREPEVERDELGRRKWPEEKIPVDLEPINGFNLRAQVVGRGGDNVKFIQNETSCKVQIKGRGSGFQEPQTLMESDEPMYLHIAGPQAAMVAEAKKLCLELLENVKKDYQQYKERPPQHRFGHDSYSNGRSGSGYGDRPPRERNHSYGQSGQSNQSAQPGQPGQPGNYNGYAGYGSTPDAQASSSAHAHHQNSYQQYNYYATGAAQAAQAAAADPYAQYGGYESYLAYYWAYQQQVQQQQAQQGPVAPGTGGAAHPAPEPAQGIKVEYGSHDGGSSGGYNAVPPPPGL